MKASILLVSIGLFLVTSSARAELTAAQIKECASFVGNEDILLALSGKEDGVRYKFEGSSVYKIKLPPKAAKVHLNLTVFKTSKDLCFSTAQPYGERLKDLKEKKDIQSCALTPPVGFEKLDGDRLNEAFEAVMDQYRRAIDDFMIDQGADGKVAPATIREQGGDLRIVGEGFKQCTQISPLSKYAQAKLNATQAALDKALKAYHVDLNKPDTTPKARSRGISVD